MEKLRKGIINLLCEVLASIDVSKLESKTRILITRSFIATKSISKEITELKEEISKKLITDEFKELQNKETKTEKETIKLEKLTSQINKEFAELINPILEEEVEIGLKKINEEEYDKLVGEVISLNITQLDFLHQIFVEDKTKAVEVI